MTRCPCHQRAHTHTEPAHRNICVFTLGGARSSSTNKAGLQACLGFYLLKQGPLCSHKRALILACKHAGSDEKNSLISISTLLTQGLLEKTSDQVESNMIEWVLRTHCDLAYKLNPKHCTEEKLRNKNQNLMP